FRANCAEALLEGGRAEDAEVHAKAGLAAAPGHVGCAAVLARALFAAGSRQEAVRQLREGAALSRYKDLRWTLAHLLLRAGALKEGFRLYEARREAGGVQAQVTNPGLSKPEWRGEPLEGRRLLVMHEQGLGDTLFAMRYTTGLAKRGEKVSAVVASP